MCIRDSIDDLKTGLKSEISKLNDKIRTLFRRLDETGFVVWRRDAASSKSGLSTRTMTEILTQRIWFERLKKGSVGRSTLVPCTFWHRRTNQRELIGEKGGWYWICKGCGRSSRVPKLWAHGMFENRTHPTIGTPIAPNQMQDYGDEEEHSDCCQDIERVCSFQAHFRKCRRNFCSEEEKKRAATGAEEAKR